MSLLTLNEAVEWRIPIWAPAVKSALGRASSLLPCNAKVLEVGYNSGMMSCYMAGYYGWNIVGYDISYASQIKSNEMAMNYGVEKRTDFRVCLPDETYPFKDNTMLFF